MRLSSYVAAVAVLSVSLAAHADDIFTLSDGTNNITFQLPSSPTVGPSATCPAALYHFCVLDVPVTANGTTTTANYIAFYTTTESGGLAIEEDAGFLLSQYGPSLFVGTITDPTFQIGTVDLMNFATVPSTFEGNFTVTIASTIPPTIAPTPEPSSFALLGTGLLGVAGAMKRRFA